MKRCMNFNNITEEAMTKVTKVLKAEQIKPVLTPEQARRVEQIATRDGAIPKLDVLSAVCSVSRLREVYHVEKLKQEREKQGELER